MIAVALRVVELDQERRPLHAVVMLLPPRGFAGPRERDPVGSGLLDLLGGLGGNVGLPRG